MIDADAPYLPRLHQLREDEAANSTETISYFNIFDPSTPDFMLNSSTRADHITNGLTQGNTGGACMIEVGGSESD